MQKPVLSLSKDDKAKNRNPPTISLIACIGQNRELGYKNDLIWKIPEDMAYFRQITSGHVVVMGQRTYESIGRPLPKRINVVLSDNIDFHPDGVLVARSMDEALELARDNESEEIFFIGGAYVYSQAIKFADKLHLTLVDATSTADTFFPKYDDFEPIEKVREGEYKGTKYEFVIFDKNA